MNLRHAYYYLENSSKISSIEGQQKKAAVKAVLRKQAYFSILQKLKKLISKPMGSVLKQNASLILKAGPKGLYRKMILKMEKEGKKIGIPSLGRKTDKLLKNMSIPQLFQILREVSNKGYSGVLYYLGIPIRSDARTSYDYTAVLIAVGVFFGVAVVALVADHLHDKDSGISKDFQEAISGEALNEAPQILFDLLAALGSMISF